MRPPPSDPPVPGCTLAVVVHRVLLSAHRGGCGRNAASENTLAAFEAAAATAAEYIEFDIQRTADGVFLLTHDDRVRLDGYWVPIGQVEAATVDRLLGTRVRYAEVLALLAATGKKAHLDLKFVSPAPLYADPGSTWEADAVREALRFLPEDHIIVTTAEDRSVRAVRDWSEDAGLDLLVGLSIGRHRLTGMGWCQKVAWRVEELFPGRRIIASRANLVVAQRHLARVRLLAWAHRHHLPVLVWTVDNHKEMRRLMADGRVWMITSNYPELGLSMRTT